MGAAVLTAIFNHGSGGGGDTVVASTSFYTNLNPATAGDVDLGAVDGVPLQDRSVGETCAIPLRVNTEGMYLGTFDVYVYFDSTVLSIDDPKAAITFNPNTHQIKSGILNAVTDGGELHFSENIDSNTLRNNDALLVNIEFEAVGAGMSEICGYRQSI
jgi:hypothetical protein